MFVELGRELYEWLDGDQGQLSALLERAARPLVFEIQGPRSPSDAAWAVLRAPFELLARPGGGLLAEDELARFCVVRRLGPPAEKRPDLDKFRLGLAFMASSPRGDYDEAAELQRKRLEVNRQLGDLEGIAAADWDLAQIDLTRQDYESALPRLMESFQILGRLQRPDAIATVGSTLGGLLMAAGQADLARWVLSDAQAAATKIGRTDLVQQINQLLNPPAQGNEET